MYHGIPGLYLHIIMHIIIKPQAVSVEMRGVPINMRTEWHWLAVVK